jgi:putative ABC transport system permease protein
MIRFLIKGLLRDKHRSRLPLIVVTIGVMLTILLTTWINGVLGDSINLNAKLSTGHVKVITRAYRESMDQIPVDLSLTGSGKLLDELRRDFPAVEWVERIEFGGLLDVPDANGETKSQGPFTGIAANIFNPGSGEIERMNLSKIIVDGRLPSSPGEVLISSAFARKLSLNPGDKVTFIGSTMYGEMSISNYKVAGTIRYGISALDKGSVIMDISDARKALDMEDASNEILGFIDREYYDDAKATIIASSFAAKHTDNDKFAPVMLRLRDQNDLGSLIDLMSGVVGIISFIFIIVLSVVLWNAGLVGGLRRYGEVGLRLAMGEGKGHIYRSMIAESLVIGIAGSVLGTAIGLALSYWMQQKGLDFSSAMKDATMLMPGVFRTRITTEAWFIGFIPGIFATVLGTMLSGIGIYRRQTARLFKELQS